MGMNCAPLLADLFLFCYERDFMMSLSEEKQSEVIEAFSSTSRYLDDLLNIDNDYFDGLIRHIYPSALQLNKANSFETEAPFFLICICLFKMGLFHANKYDKRNYFDFEIVSFTYFDGDVPCQTSYGVYISQLIRFAIVSSHVTDFNTRNTILNGKLLNQGYWYHKLRNAFSKFYRRHFD